MIVDFRLKIDLRHSDPALREPRRSRTTRRRAGEESRELA